jgi:hypothetical protein
MARASARQRLSAGGRCRWIDTVHKVAELVMQQGHTVEDRGRHVRDLSAEPLLIFDPVVKRDHRHARHAGAEGVRHWPSRLG